MILPRETSETIRPRRYVFILLCIAAILCISVVAFRRVGYWLVVDDTMTHADAIVVLSGAMPYRAEEAAQLFKNGSATEVWVSRPENSSAALDAMGIGYTGEEEYNREVLLHAGVADSAIHIFPNPIVNTEEEIESTIQQMQAANKSKVIIVTSPPHTRRVRALWRKLAPADLQMMIHPAPEDLYDAAHWWRTTRDSLAVSREVLGLINVWAGLPVRPRDAAKR